jgi:hypothetical protein
VVVLKNVFRLALGTEETYVIDNNKLIRNNITFPGNTQMTENSMLANITYTNTSSKRTLQGNNLSNPLFRGYFTPRSYNFNWFTFENATGQQLYAGVGQTQHWNRKIINMMISQRILANFNGKYDFTSWLNADFRIGT